MFSWEIDNYINQRGFVLSEDEYFNITDYKKNPQLARVTYNSFSNNYTIRTTDGYCWIVFVKNDR